jgi:hypothetical protein
MPLGNSLIGDSLFIPSGREMTAAPSGEGTFDLRRAVSGGDQIPRYVALFLLIAVGIIAAVHIGGLRAMVTVGGS